LEALRKYNHFSGFEFLKNRKTTVLILILAVILVIRISFIGVMGLMPQDAYYFFYSEHPALSYYDHPPAVAFLLWSFTALLGKKVFVIKLAASFVTLLTLFSFYKLSRYFLDADGVVKANVLLFSTTMISILSLVVTPDVPLMLFWTLSLITLYFAIFQNKKVYWLWSGILMGLAFDSKYTALFLPFGVFLFLLLTPSYRKMLLSPWLYACMLLFIATISPVVIWNVQHDFASFRFQSVSRAGEMNDIHISLKNFFGVIGHQAFLLIPVLFFSMLLGIWKVAKNYRLRFSTIPARRLFLLCFFIPVFVGFLVISFFYWVKINWMMPAYITGIIWVSSYLSDKWVRIQLIITAIIHVAVAAEVIFYPLVIKSDDTWVGWGELAKDVRQLKKSYPNDFIFSADDYKTSAVLNFYFKEMIYGKNIIGEPALQFDYINTNLQTLAGKDALFIDSRPDLKTNDTASPPAFLNKYFDQVKPLPAIQIKRDNRVVRSFNVYVCRKYDPYGYFPYTTDNH